MDIREILLGLVDVTKDDQKVNWSDIRIRRFVDATTFQPSFEVVIVGDSQFDHNAKSTIETYTVLECFKHGQPEVAVD